MSGSPSEPAGSCSAAPVAEELKVAAQAAAPFVESVRWHGTKSSLLIHRELHAVM